MIRHRKADRVNEVNGIKGDLANGVNRENRIRKKEKKY